MTPGEKRHYLEAAKRERAAGNYLVAACLTDYVNGRLPTVKPKGWLAKILDKIKA